MEMMDNYSNRHEQGRLRYFVMKAAAAVLVCCIMLSVICPCLARAAGDPSATVTKKTVTVGKMYKIKLRNIADDAIISYKSSKKSIATVSAAGKVKGCKVGKATIYISVEQDKKTYEFEIAIIVKSKGTSSGKTDSKVTQAPKDGILSSFTSADLAGNKVTEKILSGHKLTMVNIWGTYCGPCIQEMPDLGELNKEYEDKGFQVVGIICDVYDPDDYTAEDAKYIIEETGADYIHMISSEDLNSKFLNSVQYVPTTMFVDEYGCVVGSEKEYVGSNSKEGWANIIDGLLEQVD